MKILFLLANMHSPYEGIVRPFINWAKELAKNDYEVHLVTIECGMELINFTCSMRSHGIKQEDAKDANNVMDYIGQIKPDIVITDDSIDRLKLITKIKNRTRVRTAVYIQILFGAHAIAEIFDLKYLSFEEKLKYNIAKLVPFVILKNIYKEKLLRHDILIANSKTTSSLLNVLYGIETYGIVYPPVDTSIFHPYNNKKKEQLMLYLGSHAGDTDEGFVKRIIKTVLRYKNTKLIVFGNKRLLSRLTKVINRNKDYLYILSGVSDRELARMYSSSKFTICPQKWETFGYVAAESVACGTPVLAFNVMGLAETIEQSKLGFAVYNSRSFLKILERIVQNRIRLTNTTIYPEKLDFSINNSTRALIKVLNNV